MPNQPKTPNRVVRWAELPTDPAAVGWAELGAAAAAEGLDRAAVLRQLAAWWLRKPGAKLPARPAIQDPAAKGATRPEGDHKPAGTPPAGWDALEGLLTVNDRGQRDVGTFAQVSQGEKSSAKGPHQSPAL